MRAPHAALEYLAVSSEASVESQLISESTSLAHLHQHVRTTITKWMKAKLTNALPNDSRHNLRTACSKNNCWPKTSPVDSSFRGLVSPPSVADDLLRSRKV